MRAIMIATLLMVAMGTQAFEGVQPVEPNPQSVLSLSVKCRTVQAPEGVDPVYWSGALQCQYGGNSGELERLLAAITVGPDGYKWKCHPNGSRYSHWCVQP